MNDAKIEKLVQKVKERMDKEKLVGGARVRTEYQKIADNNQLIAEKGLKVGQKVNLRLLKMESTVKSIDKEEPDLPIEVERADGKIFSYTPSEVDPL